LVDEPELTIVSMASPIGVVAQSQEVSKLGHGWVGMLIIDWVGVVSSRGPNAWRRGGPRSQLALLSLKTSLGTAVRLVVEIAGG
jgi:hypothetical protein